MQNTCIKKDVEEFVIIEEKDALALAALEALCFPGGWSAAQYARVMDDPNYLILALRSNEAIRAYVVLYHILDELEILNIGTHPDHRGAGFAAHLLRHIQENICRQLHIRRIILDVRPSNIPAVRLYTRFNFVEVGRRPRYYSPDSEDALLFEWLCPDS